MIDSVTTTTRMSPTYPTKTMREEIVRRIQLPVDNPEHMPANGTYLSGDSLATMIKYFSW
jgi:hypothetical protein